MDRKLEEIIRIWHESRSETKRLIYDMVVCTRDFQEAFLNEMNICTNRDEMIACIKRWKQAVKRM